MPASRFLTTRASVFSMSLEKRVSIKAEGNNKAFDDLKDEETKKHPTDNSRIVQQVNLRQVAKAKKGAVYSGSM